jgi:hypothetical protein
MNRHERRKLGLKAPVATYTLTASQIEAMKEDAVKKGIERAYLLMLAIPVMIIHDKFGELMKREGRENRFADLCITLYKQYDEGYVDLSDLRQCLEEEAGIKVEGLRL